MSVRSNQDRLNADHSPLEQHEAPPLPTPSSPESSAPLNFVTPTDFVELPSEGKFYPPNHPLCEKTVIEMRHMTAKDEDIITSTTLLKQGVALDRMLQGLVVDKTINIKNLILGDKNALIIAARINGYGSSYATEVACVACKVHQEYTFDLRSLNVNEVSQQLLDEYDVTITENNTFLLPLPKTEYKVELRLLTGIDEEKFTKINKNKKKHKLIETVTTDQLKAIIVSVNGVNERGLINEFVGNLPALDSRYIRRVYQKVMPTVDLSHHFECSECGLESRLEVPFTTDFFWSL